MLTIRLMQTPDGKWYWAVFSPSGVEEYYSKIFDELNACAANAKAHIYNMNNVGVQLLQFDERIKPDLNPTPPAFEVYFRLLYKLSVSIDEVESNEIKESLPPQDAPKIKSKPHLTLIKNED